jgi:amidophosphoribosyltransferase
MYPCYFGTDIDSTDNLIAAHHSVAEICAKIGADSLGFLNVEYVDKLAEHCARGFCKGCFTGEYPMRPCPPENKTLFERPLSKRGEAEGAV